MHGIFFSLGFLIFWGVSQRGLGVGEVICWEVEIVWWESTWKASRFWGVV